jgi:xylulokinase
LAGARATALRATGGCVKSDVMCQVLADVLDREIVQVRDPELATARGAAWLAAKATGAPLPYDELSRWVPERARYRPTPERRPVYDRLFAAFVGAYRSNRGLFARLNG